MKKEVIGHVGCPVCDHADAEVKEDKNGRAFIFCPDCNTQVFTRDAHRDAKLRAKMRPVTVTVTVTVTDTEPKQPAPAATAPVTVPVPNTPPKGKSGTPAAPAAKTTQPAVPVPAPVKKKSGWLTPLLAGGGDD